MPRCAGTYALSSHCSAKSWPTSRVRTSWTSSERSAAVAKLEWSEEGRARSGGLAERLPKIPTGTALLLARAFAAYFQLANVTEQVHRAAELGQARRAERTLLRDTLERVSEHCNDRESVGAAIGQPRVPSRLHGAPDRVGAPFCSLQAPRRGASGASPRSRSDACRREPTCRPAARDDPAAMADERDPRMGRLRPEDEAQNVLYYLSQLYDSAVPTLLEDLDDELARHGIVLPFSTSTLRFGTWVGGDRDGNPSVTPAVTTDVLLIQHELGFRKLVGLVEQFDAGALEFDGDSRRFGRALGKPGSRP